MKRKSSNDLPKWRVTRIVGSAAREVCQLEAKSADEAVKRTIKEFEITDPHQQSRLGAYRVA
jgi:hypothetical protein